MRIRNTESAQLKTPPQIERSSKKSGLPEWAVRSLDNLIVVKTDGFTHSIDKQLTPVSRQAQ